MAERYAIFYADGSGEYAVPTPRAATWEFPILDDTPDGDVIVSGVGTVAWTFDRLTVAQYDAIRDRRGAKGAIRLRTTNDRDQWVVCSAHIDPNPAPRNLYRGSIVGPVVTFRMVEAV